MVIAVAAAALFLAGCQTVKHTPLAETAGTQMQGKTFAVARYPLPDFSAMTAGKVAFGMIGAAAMIAEGNETVKVFQIPDPAIQISDTLGAALASQRGLQKVDVAGTYKGDTIPKIIAAYPGVDYIVDVRTVNWMFGYYPTNWNHYRVIYLARFRLIDTASGKAVAGTNCQTVQGDDKNPPNKGQLFENHGALLKEYFVKAATTCTDLLAKDLLKLGPPPAAQAQAAKTG
jgi:hypothetical protein